MALQSQSIDTSNGPALTDIVSVARNVCKTLKRNGKFKRYFFEEFETFDETAAKNISKAMLLKALYKSEEKLTALSMELHSIHEAIEQTAAELEVGMGKIGVRTMLLYVTSSGQSPSMDVTLVGIGRDRVLCVFSALLILFMHKTQQYLIG